MNSANAGISALLLFVMLAIMQKFGVKGKDGHLTSLMNSWSDIHNSGPYVKYFWEKTEIS